MNLNPRHPVRLVARLVALWDAGRLQQAGETGLDEHDGITMAILRHRHEIRRAIDLTGALPLHPIPAELAAFCYLIFARENEQRARAFFVELGAELGERVSADESDLARRASPTHRLAWQFIRRYRSKYASPQADIALGLTFKAWKYYRTGEQVRILRVAPSERWWDLGGGREDGEEPAKGAPLAVTGASIRARNRDANSPPTAMWPRMPRDTHHGKEGR